MCRELILGNSAIQKSWENTTRIISAFQQNGSKLKRFLKPEQSEVHEGCFKWFKQERSDYF